MATGVVYPNDTEGSIFSFNCDPYSSSDKKTEFSVTNSHLAKEVTCCWKLNPIEKKEPCAKGW